MNRTVEFAGLLDRALAQAADSDREFAALLEAHGFSYGARSAANLRLLAAVFPRDLLVAITLCSLSTPLPDMALNGLERIANVVPHDELVTVCTKKRMLAQLLAICGSSPFLTNIICRKPFYFHRLFVEKEMDVRRSEAESLAALQAFTDGCPDYAELLPLLRRFKFAEILRIGARDLTGLAPLEEVTAELAALASSTLQLAYEFARKQLVEEHGLPLMRTPNGIREADLVVMGMGKLGGRELNFSSDIDLIYFYSSNQGESAGIDDGAGGKTGVLSLHAFFVKLAEMISRAISQVTEHGFVFRVDLGLRPEGKSGDVAVSLRSAEIYYESWGQSWERSAMLKARPVAGSLELGEQLLRTLEPFIYRRYLDYTLIEDMMSMKQKIDRSLTREREGEYNIKLGRGGIREIEFFIQALQLVYAGKRPEIRERNSLKALEALCEAKLVSPDDCATLRDAYRFLRTVEHRIQVVQERQTHNLPAKEEEFHALARRCGYLRPGGVERFRATLEGYRAKVSQIYGNLFLSSDRKLREEVKPEVYFFFEASADPDLIKDMLAERRFRDPDKAYQNLMVLRDGPPRVRLSERGRRTLEKIAPIILQHVFESPDPDMALANLDKFLCAVGSRSTVYALLAENRETLRLLASLFGTSEFLSKIFITQPELLETMVSRSYALSVKSRDTMRDELAALLARTEHFEERLDVLRRYRHEEFLRIGMNDIYGQMGQTELTSQLTSLAEVCLEAAYGMAREELARFGRPTWRDEEGKEHEARFAVVGMGKMGGVELNYHSDLDVIYVYDHQGMTDGEKQVTNHEYFAKLGQKIISILTTQTREGYVYKIDTRLRPSGNAGPLVTSLESFADYHHREAQIWERQALTKARVVLGEERFRRRIEEIIAHAVYGGGIDEGGRKEIHRLRMRMENELAREKKGSYNIKTGRGGIVDVEFIVQYLQLGRGVDFPAIRTTTTLLALKGMRSCGILEEGEFQTLLQGYKFLRRLENRLRIVHDYSMNDLGGPQDYLDRLARRLGYDDKLRHPGEALMADYEQITEGIRSCYERILGSPPLPALHQ